MIYYLIFSGKNKNGRKGWKLRRKASGDNWVAFWSILHLLSVFSVALNRYATNNNSSLLISLNHWMKVAKRGWRGNKNMEAVAVFCLQAPAPRMVLLPVIYLCASPLFSHSCSYPVKEWASLTFFFGLLCFVEPMRTSKTLKIAEIQARHIAVDWESLGYNITRCHTFNVTICYHYFCGRNESKADCLDMDPKAPQHVVDHLPPYTNVSLKMILTNPEGRKESEETIIQTDEDGMHKCYYRNYVQVWSRQVEGIDFVCYSM